MKYHGHILKKEHEDLGEPEEKFNFLIHIYKDGEEIAVAASFGSAKDFIDSGYDSNYL